MDSTPLDAAYAAMEAAPDDDAARLRYYERLVDGELFLLLETEAEDDKLTPRMFSLEEGPVVLVFDTEDRLASFAAAVAPYAALPGRVIARFLAGQGIGMGVNLGVPASSYMVSPEALDWLAEALDHVPDEVIARPQSFLAPNGLPERLIEGLNAKLSQAGGLATCALLVGVCYEDGRRGHMLAFVDATAGAQAALAQAAAEALTFSGIEAGEIDVAFLAGEDSALARIAPIARRFELPSPVVQKPATPSAPGMDPDRPPILR